ncbi:actin-binding protein WASF3-like [Haliotis cracherodii]|uniref:actin-binding protein WASF3-like n=1 Tax=Haliotis cracherodii TaxID=6455 RepID=UPI0039EA8FC9
MPLTKRRIEPVNVSRVKVDKTVRNELECVTNNTLANIIRELSSLSRHAEDMFTELSHEATVVFGRSVQLQKRIDHLRDKVTQLNATVEEVSLTDIHTRKPFKSTIVKEQQVISRLTIPLALNDNYNQCESPPALDKLNEFREDGKDCMKFYTDSTYFVELWVREMEKEMEEKKSELNKKRDKKKRPKQADKRKPRQIADPKAKWNTMKYGEEFKEEHVAEAVKRVSEHPEGRRLVHQNSTGSSHSPHNRPGTLPVDHASPGHHGQPHHGHPQNQDPRIHNHASNVANGPYQADQQRNEDPAQTHVRGSGMPQNQQFQYQQYQMSPGRSSAAMLGSPHSRPSQPPPAPPPPMDQQSPSDRNNLPPPPPPPLDPAASQTATPPMQRQPIMYNHLDGSPGRGRGSQRNSPARQPSLSSSATSSPHRATPEGVEPPPPPLSPPISQTPDTPPSHDSMPPPPSPPPPLNFSQTPSPPPPPPPPPLMTNSQGPPPPPPLPPAVMNGSLRRDQLDVASVSSTGSTVTNVSNSEPQKPTVGQERSDLLAEIRLGDWYKKLRRVEERREKQKKVVPAGRFDVQALMDRAVEMRRKVIEDSDSGDGDSGSDDDDWDTD